jgi:hypothetical protein
MMELFPRVAVTQPRAFAACHRLVARGTLRANLDNVLWENSRLELGKGPSWIRISFQDYDNVSSRIEKPDPRLNKPLSALRKIGRGRWMSVASSPRCAVQQAKRPEGDGAERQEHPSPVHVSFVRIHRVFHGTQAEAPSIIKRLDEVSFQARLRSPTTVFPWGCGPA